MESSEDIDISPDSDDSHYDSYNSPESIEAKNK